MRLVVVTFAIVRPPRIPLLRGKIIPRGGMRGKSDPLKSPCIGGRFVPWGGCGILDPSLRTQHCALMSCPVLSLVVRALGSPPMQGDLGGLFLCCKDTTSTLRISQLDSTFFKKFLLNHEKARNFTKNSPCDHYISAITWFNKSPAFHSVIPVFAFYVSDQTKMSF